MNIVFLGSSKFAVPSLSGIISSPHKVVCAVTQPDRAKGRGMALACTEVKNLAASHKLRIYQPQDINSKESLEFLKGLNPDIFVVVAFGQILSQEALSIPKIFSINLHASLLPKYRGAAPIRRAIINGENQAGLTVIKMTERLDAGPIIMQKGISISDSDDALILEERMSHLGSTLLCQALDLIQEGKYSLVNQDEKQATLAPKLRKDAGLINWDRPARDIFNLIRGCAGWPGAFTHYREKMLKIHSARIAPKCQSAKAPKRQSAKVPKCQGGRGRLSEFPSRA